MAVPSILMHPIVVRLGPAAQRTVDVVLAVAAGLTCLFAASETPLPPAAGLREPAWLTLLTAVALGAPLAVRRRWPVASALTVGVAAGLALATGIVPDYASAGPLVAAGAVLYTVGLRVPGRRGLVTALAATGLLLAGAMTGDASTGGPGPAAVGFAGLVCGAGWALGWTLRERRRHAELTAAQTTARAVAEERLRIAREMHDIIGHSLSLIAVKAAVANHVARQRPEEAGAALTVIESASRGALAELRRSLGALRSEPDFSAPPTLEDLARLADRAGSAGVAVLLDVRGGEDAPEGVVLAAFRIVQESLTNVVKHAAPAGCRVDVFGGNGRLQIEIIDDGTRRPAPTGDGAGIAGMRERVCAHGGAFSAGPQEEGGFAVSATLPYGPGE
jgi:signal transduction histidine kinase